MLHSGFFIPLATARGSVTRHPWPPACSARSPVNFALRAQAGKDARVPATPSGGQGCPRSSDADPRWWLPCEWHLVEVNELVKIEPHFHFKRIAPTIYELRPIEDQSATDKPQLQNLLPENRPEEVKKCFNSSN